MTRKVSLLDVPPRTKAPLDPGFRPAAVASHNYERAVAEATRRERVLIGIERENGLVCRYETEVFPAGDYDEDTIRYVERAVKFLLWSRGGWRIAVHGPQNIVQHLRAAYKKGGARAFDAELMSRVYERDFEVLEVRPEDVPEGRESEVALGGHLDGCRIGFDLGASDYKVAAVIDGNSVFSEELPWDPKKEADPAYHYEKIREGLRKAAEHMPRVDAIGGSSAGVFINNRPMVASLFRAVPLDRFERDVKPMFIRLGQEWNVPLDVINDGDVTALAGALSLEKNAMLGVAMGSSQAAGYLNRGGRILGWLNELAFAPVDYNSAAAVDEWSGDAGVGVMYFSQQAVNKLLPAAGIALPEEMGLPERLKAVQEMMQQGDTRVVPIYETIGVYLGYTIVQYADFYDFENLLVLGRVTSGEGGNVIITTARRILSEEFPDIAARISLQVPDEKSRRVGQAVAAASLPQIRKG